MLNSPKPKFSLWNSQKIQLGFFSKNTLQEINWQTETEEKIPTPKLFCQTHIVFLGLFPFGSGNSNEDCSVNLLLTHSRHWHKFMNKMTKGFKNPSGIAQIGMKGIEFLH